MYCKPLSLTTKANVYSKGLYTRRDEVGFFNALRMRESLNIFEFLLCEAKQEE